MRDKAITFRTEYSTSRLLTWLVNNYNLEHYSAATKTDLLEGLIILAAEDQDILNNAMRRGYNVESATREDQEKKRGGAKLL